MGYSALGSHNCLVSRVGKSRIIRERLREKGLSKLGLKEEVRFEQDRKRGAFLTRGHKYKEWSLYFTRYCI